MKETVKVLFLIFAIAGLQTIASAQSRIGYTIVDNNRDDSPFPEQQFYSFNIDTGAGTLIAGLGGSGNYPNAGINREYEGLASVGSILFGVGQNLAGFNCNTGQDPLTGVNSDLRRFSSTGASQQIGETCIDFGEEVGAAYNPVDGYIYAIASDDLLPDAAPRSRLYRISTSTGLATQIGTGITLTAGSGGSPNPSLDGVAIIPNGQLYATDGRFSPNAQGQERGGLYRVFLTGPNAGRATFIKNLFGSDVNRDTGAANLGNQIYILLETGQLYNTNVSPSGAVVGPVNLSLPGCIGIGGVCRDMEGFDIPNPPLN